MKTVFLFLSLVAHSLAWAQTLPPTTSLLGVFAGTSPCGAAARPLHGIGAGEPCDQLTWRLTLYQDAQTHTPTVFTLASEAVHVGPNRTPQTTGIRMITGTWIRRQERTTNIGTTVYQLQWGPVDDSLSLLLIHPTLLHPLSPEGNLLVGSEGSSYTLRKLGR